VIAQRWCAECHAIGTDQKQATPDVPTFAEIARRRAADPDDLATFLMNPHPHMPDMQIGRNEAADLAAFILSQKAE
jgi:mono/diheme cytochrome c family protein